MRTGRCLPYGSGIVFWALGEVLRAECGIVEADSSEEAWQKLRSYVAELMGKNEHSDREAALIGRLLGVDVPGELVPEEDDPERMREAFLSALRRGIEAMATRHPFVIAFEDIHWADDGLLDAIEHLAQWVRAPLMLVCLARDELLDRRPSWGGGRRSATQLMLSPLSDEHSRALVRALLPAGKEVVPAVAERSGGNPLFAEEMARRITEEGTIEAAELPDTVQAVLAARLDSLEPFERRLVQQASVVGRTFPEGALAELARAEGRDLDRALISLQEKDILAPAAEGPLVGEREMAFKHVLIRDVAYGMLPKAVRSRKHFEVGAFIEERAGDRLGRARGAAWPSTTGAPPRSAVRAASRRRSSRPCAGARSASSRRPATLRRSCTPTARRRRTTAWRARSAPRTAAPPVCGSGRSWATSRCGSAASTRRSASGRTASSGTAARRTSSAWPTSTARSARRCRTRASARRPSSTTRRASTC